MNEVKVNYGALAKPIEEQLNEQGYTLGDEKVIKRTQKIQDSLIMCKFHVFTDAEYSRITQRFHKKTMKKIKPLKDVKE